MARDEPFVLSRRLHRARLGANPVRAPGSFPGPFRAARTAPTALVVDTTYDPVRLYGRAFAVGARGARPFPTARSIAWARPFYRFRSRPWWLMNAATRAASGDHSVAVPDSRSQP